MSRVALAIVVLAQLAALVVVCVLIGDNGWDDGAITLAFSRTFAHHGVIALTPRSETVEGFSSVSWFLLNGVAALAGLSWRGSIFVSQVLSALCIAASTALLGRTCALLRLDKPFSTLTVLTFAAWGCSFSEAGNGMEMGLLAAAFLVMVNELLSPQPRLLVLAAGVVLAIATRFEAVLYVGLLALGVVSMRGRRAFWVMALAGLGTVVLLSGWRWAAFSDVLPNTFWAKRWPPYAGFDLWGRLKGAVELPSFFLAPVIALVLARRSGFDLAGAVQARRRAFVILGLPVLGAVVMGVVIGAHWGYRGRMPYFAFPLVPPLFALLLCDWASRSRVAVAAAACALSVGVSLTAFPWGPLGAALHGGSFGVTPHTYAESGQVFRRFASAADRPNLTILTPDLGGLALCCDELRLVDLGLLSNHTLARRGPGALADVLEAESPDIVEAHWQWASAGKLYELPVFRARYAPAFAGGTKLWIRRDVAQAIESKGRGGWVAADRADVQQALRAHRYANHDLPADRAAFERAERIFALDGF